jgi:hypothetical protein
VEGKVWRAFQPEQRRPVLELDRVEALVGDACDVYDPASWSCVSPSRTLRCAKPADAVMTLPESRGARIVSSVRTTSARTPTPSSRRSRKAKLIGAFSRGGWDLPDALRSGRAKPCLANAGSRPLRGLGRSGNSA